MLNRRCSSTLFCLVSLCSLLYLMFFVYLRKNGSRKGAVVRALASHQCVPGSITGRCIIFGLSLLLVLFLAMFFSGYYGFPLSSKTNISKCQALYHEPLARVIAQVLPVFDIKFELTIIIYNQITNK